MIYKCFRNLCALFVVLTILVSSRAVSDLRNLQIISHIALEHSVTNGHGSLHKHSHHKQEQEHSHALAKEDKGTHSHSSKSQSQKHSAADHLQEIFTALNAEQAVVPFVLISMPGLLLPKVYFKISDQQLPAAVSSQPLYRPPIA